MLKRKWYQKCKLSLTISCLFLHGIAFCTQVISATSTAGGPHSYCVSFSTSILEFDIPLFCGASGSVRNIYT